MQFVLLKKKSLQNKATQKHSQVLLKSEYQSGCVAYTYVLMTRVFFSVPLFWICHDIAKATPAEGSVTRNAVTVAWTKR